MLKQRLCALQISRDFDDETKSLADKAKQTSSIRSRFIYNQAKSECHFYCDDRVKED